MKRYNIIWRSKECLYGQLEQQDAERLQLLPNLKNKKNKNQQEYKKVDCIWVIIVYEVKYF